MKYGKRVLVEIDLHQREPRFLEERMKQQLEKSREATTACTSVFNYD